MAIVWQSYGNRGGGNCGNNGDFSRDIAANQRHLSRERQFARPPALVLVK
jgi:hypothetical protein